MSPARRFAVGMAVAAVAVFATAVPASAHDSLVHSTPEADESLATAPESITLTYSGELLVLGDSTQGAVVLVIDESGRDWATGDVEVSGNTVTATVEPGMPDAGYQVRWQVVSEDGHPISGIVPFTIGDAEPMTATQAPTDADAPSYVPDASDPTDQSTDETDGGLRLLLVGGAGAAIAVVALVLYRILRRPKTAPAASAEGDAAEEM
ncbi:copper resistance protein CopC [Microbacterium sp. kSW2-24]|uniref:copper resistance CopC family protein n=1 Tax=Microbacterium galbinum TaxID=2851646 RepID=UPI001FFDD28E|nr:copper resistance CopC family protein [Microbacterium galbinum]MCK2022631.1 copper resistance protein CopC [Microbacterium galbinum]